MVVRTFVTLMISFIVSHYLTDINAVITLVANTNPPKKDFVVIRKQFNFDRIGLVQHGRRFIVFCTSVWPM